MDGGQRRSCAALCSDNDTPAGISAWSVDRVEAKSKRPPRALSQAERLSFLTAVAGDEKARQRDLPDLIFFMLSTGVRIGEALATLWS